MMSLSLTGYILFRIKWLSGDEMAIIFYFFIHFLLMDSVYLFVVGVYHGKYQDDEERVLLSDCGQAGESSLHPGDPHGGQHVCHTLRHDPQVCLL